MNFLAFFLIIATAVATPISVENSNVIRTPSLINSLPVVADDEENRSNLQQVTLVVLLVASINLFYIYAKLTIGSALIMCAMNPTDCTIFIPNPTAKSLAGINLKNFTFGDRQEINSLDGSFNFPSGSAIVKYAVLPNHQRSSFIVTVPTFWIPYANVPALVAFYHEAPNSANPSTGSFIPQLDSFTRFNNPSLMGFVTPHAKFPVPAGLQTTP